MTDAEQAYAAVLDGLKSAGQILNYWYEPMKLRLAQKTFYTPDFLVMASDYTLELHEVKGFWQDAAKIKIKVAAEQFDFRFVAVMGKKLPKKDGGGWEWEYEEF